MTHVRQEGALGTRCRLGHVTRLPQGFFGRLAHRDIGQEDNEAIRLPGRGRHVMQADIDRNQVTVAMADRIVEPGAALGAHASGPLGKGRPGCPDVWGDFLHRQSQHLFRPVAQHLRCLDIDIEKTAAGSIDLVNGDPGLRHGEFGFAQAVDGLGQIPRPLLDQHLQFVAVLRQLHLACPQGILGLAKRGDFPGDAENAQEFPRGIAHRRFDGLEQAARLVVGKRQPLFVDCRPAGGNRRLILLTEKSREFGIDKIGITSPDNGCRHSA